MGKNGRYSIIWLKNMVPKLPISKIGEIFVPCVLQSKQCFLEDGTQYGLQHLVVLCVHYDDLAET